MGLLILLVTVVLPAILKPFLWSIMEQREFRV